MTFAVCAKDIETRFSANWTATRWTTDGDNSFKPPINSAWVRLVMVDGLTDQISLGNAPRFRHYGTIVFQIYVPESSGARVARTHADTIAVIFRNKYFGNPIISCGSPRLTNIGENQGWYQINLSVPFYWDEDF